MKPIHFLLVLLAGAPFAAQPARADEPAACAPDVLSHYLDEVAKARAAITTLTGPFTQERTIGLLSAKVRSSGTLTLVRPDRLRWELAPPDDIVYWVTPDGLAYRSREGRGKVPAGNERIAAALSDLRVILGGDIGALRARYDLSGTCPAGEPSELRAVPRAGTSSSFQEIRFTLAADKIAPASATIVEGPRDRTEIRFGAMTVNAPVAASRMSPDG